MGIGLKMKFDGLARAGLLFTSNGRSPTAAPIHSEF